MTDLNGNHYIGGSWVSDAPHGLADILNPADGEVVETAPLGSAGLAEQAANAVLVESPARR